MMSFILGIIMKGRLIIRRNYFGARVEYEQQLLDKFMNVLTDQENDFINFYKEKFNLYVDIVRESIKQKKYTAI